MTHIREILSCTTHRPYLLPKGNWWYYQEWNHALFLHWQVPYELLRPYVPAKLQIDRFNGQCYISLVAFTMEHIRPRYLPAIKFISEFHEVNIRTYVTNQEKQGVYFLSIEAEKFLSTHIAKSLSGLPYQKATIKRTAQEYHCSNKETGNYFDCSFELGKEFQDKPLLHQWLTERYCLYLEGGDKLYRYDIHHKEWILKEASIKSVALNYSIGNIRLTETPDLVHYSEGVKVLSWKKQELV